MKYSEVFDFDDELLIPPEDPISNKVYVECKSMEYLSRDEVDEDEAEDDEEEDVEELDITTPPSPASVLTPSVENQNGGQELVVREKEDIKAGVPATNWKLLRVIADSHQGWVRSLDIDPVTNRWFVTGASDATIKIWDLATLQIKATLTGHIMGVRSLKVSSRFPYLFSGSEDKTVRCWDLERTNNPSGCQIRDYHGHVGGIYALDLHPDLDLLVTGGRDSAIRVWDIRSRTQVMILTGHRGDVTSITCDSNDPQIISSSMDGTVRLWDLRKSTTQLTITHHSKSIRLTAVHPQEATMCSADTGGNFKQWVLPRGDLLDEWSTETKDSTIVNTLSINPIQNSLFAGYDDGKMEFYDYSTGGLLQSMYSKPVPGLSDTTTIYASKFDKLGSRFITCEGDKSIKIWSE